MALRRLLVGCLAALGAITLAIWWDDIRPPTPAPESRLTDVPAVESAAPPGTGFPDRGHPPDATAIADQPADAGNGEAPPPQRLLRGRCIDWDGTPLARGNLYILDTTERSPAASTEIADDGTFSLLVPTSRLLGDHVQATVDDEHSTVFSGLVRCADNVTVFVQSTRHPSWRMQGRITLIGVVPELWSLLVYDSSETARLIAAAPLAAPYRGESAEVSILAMLPEYRSHQRPLTLCVVGMGRQRGVLAKVRCVDGRTMAKQLADGLTIEVLAHTVFVDAPQGAPPVTSISLRSVAEDPPCTMEIKVVDGRAQVLGPAGNYSVVGSIGNGEAVVGSILSLGAQNRISWQQALAGAHTLAVTVVDTEGRPRQRVSGSLGIRDGSGRLVYSGMRRTSSDVGRMEWHKLAAGTYELMLQSGPSESPGIAHEVAVPSAWPLQFAIPTTPNSPLRLALSSDAPELLDTVGNGAEAHLRPWGSAVPWQRAPLDRGLWVIRGLAPGDWQVAVATGEWRGTGRSRPDGDGASCTADVRLSHHVPIRGTLVSASGLAPAALWVALRGNDLPWARAPIAGDGSFELWSQSTRAVLDVLGPRDSVLTTYEWRDGEACRITVR